MNYSTAFEGGYSALGGLLGFIVMIIIIASFWRLFSKAGRPGILAIIPIVNTVVYASIGGVPCLLLLLLFVPILNVVVMFYVHFKVAEAFGQGALFGLGLFLLPFIFVPLLAFGDYEYQGDYTDDLLGKPKRKNDGF
jgi:hypothetical protein